MSLRTKICGIVAGLMSLGLGSAAGAQDYPARAITLIVPFAAGGPTDVVARIIGDHMSRTLGRQIVIENVVGGGGTTATTRVMHATPDGYTIELGHMGTHAAAVAFYPNLAYNPTTDFEPIGMAAGTPIVILARKDFPAANLKEFVAYVKANAGNLNMAHAGVGSVSFTTCLLLNSILGVKPTTVPYNGTGPAMNALAGGQVDYMCDQIVNVVPQITGGTIKAYAVATAARNPVLPDVPTTKEAGLPEFEVSAWNALFAPKGTPKLILDKLTDALDKALSDDTTRKRLFDLGSDIPDPPRRGHEALATLVKNEVARWTPVIKDAGPMN
jgi:tripartite-type tricarboxylate transporter receptor subunit TctC